MVELSNERVEEILGKETQKTEALPLILRSIYTRYMRMYEKYFDDIDALDDDKIAEMAAYHEETRSLVKYYYMDIPQDICSEINDFEKKYTSKLLGPEWHKFISDIYAEYKKSGKNRNKSEECLKAQFKEEILQAFYETMDSVFREGFGTRSKTAEKIIGGITGLLFGRDK